MQHRSLEALKALVALVGLLSAAVPLRAQTADGVLSGQVDSLFARWGTTTPGCAVGVDRDGRPLLRRAYGTANLEAGAPWSTGTISESGSVAKQFTAAALVLLALDGRLTLEDDVVRWIPEVRGMDRRITVRHLLTHTSGLPDRHLLHEAMGRPAGVVNHDNAEVMALVARLRELNFDPGEDYEYSNTGYIVAATLVERVSGKTLQEFTDARIFVPLRMTSTRWRESDVTLVPGRAAAYAGSVSNGFRNAHPFTQVIGAGGLLTTVDDLLRWEGALQSGLGVWGPVRDSLERVGRLNEGTALTYALGVSVQRWRGVRTITHTGATGGYGAVLSRYPDHDVAVAVLCNINTPNPAVAARGVVALVLGPALETIPVEPTGIAAETGVLRAVAGRYRAPRTGQPLVLTVRNGVLVDSIADRELIMVAPERFKYRGVDRMLTVLREAAQSSARIRVEEPDARAIEYVSVPKPAIAPAILAGFTGEYESRELDARLHVSMNHDSLFVTMPYGEPRLLMPLYQDGFAMGDRFVRFERDQGGSVTGLILWARRVRHLRFDRVLGSAR